MGSIIYGSFMGLLVTLLVVLCDFSYKIPPTYTYGFFILFSIYSYIWKLEIEDKKKDKDEK
jgi:hypothetical protein